MRAWNGMKKVVLFLIAALFPLLCAAEDAMRDMSRQEARPPGRPPHEFDWSRITPLGFLYILKNSEGSAISIDGKERPPANWIREEHVGQLIQLVGSHEPAAPVISGPVAYVSSVPSTVGNEAMYLIEGFRRKKYPPTTSSVHDFEANPDDYRQWWKEWGLFGRSAPPAGAGSVKVVRYGPTREEVLKDSKPADLSIADQVLLRKDEIRLGLSKTNVLVNRLTDAVEYVWTLPYNCYIRPKYTMPNVQGLYDRTRKR